MTVLDQFAMAAMQGAMANPNAPAVELHKFARLTYDIAEAMLAEKRRRERADKGLDAETPER